jgi:methyltransferase (TIGR00027 family)
MPSNNDDPIRSAQLFTILRALSGLEEDPTARNPDVMAPLFLDPGWRDALIYRDALIRRFEHKSPGAYGYALARTRYIDGVVRACLDRGLQQVVIIGAGNDSRAHRFGSDRSVTFFELDFPPTQRVKLQRVLQLGPAAGLREDVRYVPMDLNDRSIGALLQQHGYRRDALTLLICEGVTFYIEPRAVTALFTHLREAAAPGSRLVFDYALRDFIDGGGPYHGGAEALRWSREANEPMLFGTSPHDLTETCRACGLTVVSDLGADDIERLFLRRADGSLVARPLGGFRFACVETPKGGA